MPLDATTPQGNGTLPPIEAESDPERPLATVSDLYRGNVRIVGLVVESGEGIADAEVTCTPMGFGPRDPGEFGTLTMRTDASGFFSFGSHPDAFRYEIVAITPTHHGYAEAPREQATDGRLVITVRPVYYTRHEFLNADGSPFARLPTEITQLIRDSVVASTHAAWLPTTARTRILERMGVPMPDAPHIVATAFMLTPGPPRPNSVILDFPGYNAVSVGFAPRPLSEWPKGEAVHLHLSDQDRGRVLYDVEIPDVSWPSEWGEWYTQMDFRIWFVPRDTMLHSSVNRRTPAFSLAAGVRFDLKDQNFRELPYAVIEGQRRRIVRPGYPEYGFLRVRWLPVHDSSKHYGVTVRAKDDPDSRDVVGVTAVPGVTYFGPLAVGEYEILLQWFMAGSTSALSPIRNLGTVHVRKGANDVGCE